MSKKKPPPKEESADEYSAFKALLDKIAKVPKTDIVEVDHDDQDQSTPKKRAQ